MPLLIRDLCTFLCCLMMAGCQTAPQRTPGPAEVIAINQPSDMMRAGDSYESQTDFSLTHEEEKPKRATHVLRWPFTKECGRGCGTMWALIGVSLAVGLAIALNHHNKPGCIAKVKQCDTWPNCTYPPLPPGCSYDFGG